MVIFILSAMMYFGIPYIRTDYRYVGKGNHKYITEATYWNGADAFWASPTLLGHDCHAVILVPFPDRLPAIKKRAKRITLTLKTWFDEQF